jgi:acetolactate synthase I/II/III large subunit
MDKLTGAKIIADTLIEREIDYVFTLSGGHITPIYQYLEGSSVKLFDTRHEQAAVFMAEAYGKLKRKPGIALVTAGPGFTNALTPVASARIANTPLLLIAGCVGIESSNRLDLQDMKQAPVIEPMVKKAFICQNPERTGEYFDLAYRTAISGKPGPVYLELPVDILNADADPEKVRKLNTLPASKPYDPNAAAEIISMIKSAKNPVLIGGSGIWYSHAERELQEFAEKTGIPVFTSLSGRGSVPDSHPGCFESSLAIRPGAAYYANANADLVILLGSRISLFYIFGDIFKKDAKIIQVDIDGEETGRNRSIDLPVVSDLKPLLAHCCKILDEEGTGDELKKRFKSWTTTLKEEEKKAKAFAALNWENASVPLHPMRLMKEINDFMDREDDIVVADGGDTTTWMGMTRTINRAGHYLDYGLYGCLAVGLPYANAAKLLNPGKRVCMISGDGSIGFNFMEFETSIRKGLPIVVVINNDLGWGMIRHSQEIRLGHAIEDGTHIGNVDYHKMVEAMGGKGYSVDKPDEIRAALEDAFSSGKTACINVMTDPTVVSPGSIALANLGGYKA